MTAPEELAKHFRQAFFGGNWTVVHVQQTLSDVTWQQATVQVYDFNTIAVLTYHIGYFVTTVHKVLQGGPLEGHDKFSFDHPPIQSQQDWERMRNKTLEEAKATAALIEQLPEVKLWEPFTDEKYGTYYSNLHGIIEHTHYHLGQIVLIKKILAQASS